MKKQRAPFAPLCIARKLQATDRQVGVSLDFDGAAQNFGKRRLMRGHDVTVRAGDGRQRRVSVDREHQGIVQATGALQNRAAAAAPTQDFHTRLSASGQLYFAPDFIGISDDNEAMLRFPEAQQISLAAFVARIQQRLIAGEIRGRRGKR